MFDFGLWRKKIYTMETQNYNPLSVNMQFFTSQNRKGAIINDSLLICRAKIHHLLTTYMCKMNL